MLTKAEQISNLKCRVAKNAYIDLVESRYGIETCSSDYTDVMREDDLLKVDLLSSPYDCSALPRQTYSALGPFIIAVNTNVGKRYSFLNPSTTWLIRLVNFDCNPIVSVVDINNVVIEALVSYPEYGKTILITFSEPSVGYADISGC